MNVIGESGLRSRDGVRKPRSFHRLLYFFADSGDCFTRKLFSCPVQQSFYTLGYLIPAIDKRVQSVFFLGSR